MANVARNRYDAEDPMQRTAFRSSWMQPEGTVGAHIIEGKIIDINMVTWTVDFVSQFDQKYFVNVQVASPYMNPNQGEGIYAYPEVGSKCLLCIPSDGPPPFILAFIMPAETIPDTEADNAPTPSTGGAQPNKTGSTFAGGRVRAKPGDIMMKGRDGNFCILHRGGVLQIGSTSLAQRIFIPIGNIVKDISQQYFHHNVGGSIIWSMSSGPSETNEPTFYKQTFRLHSGEDKATVRLAVGSFKDPVPPPPGEVGSVEIENEGIGVGSSPLIYEIVVSPEQIGTEDGSIGPDTSKQSKLQFAFDKNGGGYLWAAGSIVLALKKKFIMRAKDTIDISTEADLNLKGKTARLDGGSLLELQGDVVRVGPGADNVAHVGSVVTVVIPPGTPLGSNSSGPVLANPLTLTGLVTTGKPTVKV